MITLVPHIASETSGGAAGSTVVFWAMAAVVGLVLAVGASTRVVARNERAVVLRSGRVARVSGPGVAFRVPAVEELRVVSLDPVDMPLVVTASTRDGVAVRIMATAVARTISAKLSASAPDPLTATAGSVERVLQQLAEQRQLDELIVHSEWLGTRVRDEVNLEAPQWGTETTSVRIDGIDTELTPASLRAIRRSARPCTRRTADGRLIA